MSLNWIQVHAFAKNNFVFLFSFVARKVFPCLKKSKNKYFSLFLNFQSLTMKYISVRVGGSLQNANIQNAYFLTKEGSYNSFMVLFFLLIEGVFGLSKWPQIYNTGTENAVLKLSGTESAVLKLSGTENAVLKLSGYILIYPNISFSCA